MAELAANDKSALSSKGVLGGLTSIASGVILLLTYFGVIPPVIGDGILGGVASLGGFLSTYGRVAAKEKINSLF